MNDASNEATMRAFDTLYERKGNRSVDKGNRSDKAFWHLDRLARSAGFDCCIFTKNIPKGHTGFSFLKYGKIECDEYDVYLLAYEDGSLLHNDLPNYTSYCYDGILTQIAEQLIAGKKIMLVHTVLQKLNAEVKVDENAELIELDNNAAQCFLFDVMLEGWLAD